MTVMAADPATGIYRLTDTVDDVDAKLARIASAIRRARYTERDLTEADRLALRQHLLDKADGWLDARLDLTEAGQ